MANSFRSSDGSHFSRTAVQQSAPGAANRAASDNGLLTCQLDNQGRILRVSPAWQLQFGLSESQLSGTALVRDHWQPPAGPCCLQGVDLCDTLGEVHHLQWLLVPDEQQDTWHATGWDITALADALEQARQQALIDPLTGLKNRRAFDERLHEELARHQRQHTPLTMLMLDVDHFKLFNDRFGHQQGDQVLKLLGQRLATHIRSIDFVARIGGEEFVVLLPDTTVTSSSQLAERLRAEIAAHQWPCAPLTISVGAATLVCAPPAAVTPERRKGRKGRKRDHSLDHDQSQQLALRLYSQADQALYQAKASGRNRLIHLGSIV